MKKYLAVILCITLLTVLSSCGKKDDTKNAPITDIPTASADDDSPANSAEEFDEKYSGEETEEYIDHKTEKEEYRSERERVEIENSLRDAEAMVESGDYEDAMMIIKSLKTRKLSKSERDRIAKMQEKMITISD